MKLRAKNPTGFLSDENRLDRVQGPGGLDVGYTYDTSGRMMTRTSAGVTTRLTWDGFDCVREETGSSVTIYHIPDGTLHSFSLDGAVFQCHLDALGSVRMITDASGGVVARLEYGAWGEEIFVSAIPALADFPYRFVGVRGVRTDSETGLVYMRQRWYDPGLARFVSRDPIGLSGGANLYSYVGGNPARFTDSAGLNPPGQEAALNLQQPLINPATLAAAAAALTEVATAAATVAPLVILGALPIAAQAMAPGPPRSGPIIFWDEFGSDRWGSRTYDARSEANDPDHTPTPFPHPEPRAKAPVVGPPYPGPNTPSKLPGPFNKGGGKQTCWLISWWSLEYCGLHTFCFYQCPDGAFKKSLTVSSRDLCPKKQTF